MRKEQYFVRVMAVRGTQFEKWTVDSISDSLMTTAKKRMFMHGKLLTMFYAFSDLKLAVVAADGMDDEVFQVCRRTAESINAAGMCYVSECGLWKGLRISERGMKGVFVPEKRNQGFVTISALKDGDAKLRYMALERKKDGALRGIEVDVPAGAKVDGRFVDFFGDPEKYAYDVRVSLNKTKGGLK